MVKSSLTVSTYKVENHNFSDIEIQVGNLLGRESDHKSEITYNGAIDQLRLPADEKKK
jgi:hypothetical protein